MSGHILGVSDMKRFALPAGWDAGELEKYRLADGTTYEQIISDIALALSLKAQQMLTHPQFGTLFSATTELGFEYANGTATVGMEERTENRIADARRGKTIGHMLPLKSYDRVLTWTWDLLRKARAITLSSDITTALYDVSDTMERNLLTRFFSNADNQLGSSGYDLAFANASANVLYTPPAYQGKTFASSHTHFVRDTTANRATAIEAAVLHLREHGIMAPYLGIVPQAQVSSYTALSNFVKPERGIMRWNGATDVSTASISEDLFFGALETKYGIIYLWETARITGDYFGLYKAFGSDDMRNPLAVRYAPDLGFSPLLQAGESRREYPLENAQIIHEYGVGVTGAPMLARLNGYCIYYNSSGDYVVPTIG